MDSMKSAAEEPPWRAAIQSRPEPSVDATAHVWPMARMHAPVKRTLGPLLTTSPETLSEPQLAEMLTRAEQQLKYRRMPAGTVLAEVRADEETFRFQISSGAGGEASIRHAVTDPAQQPMWNGVANVLMKDLREQARERAQYMGGISAVKNPELVLLSAQRFCHPNTVPLEHIPVAVWDSRLRMLAAVHAGQALLSYQAGDRMSQVQDTLRQEVRRDSAFCWPRTLPEETVLSRATPGPWNPHEARLAVGAVKELQAASSLFARRWGLALAVHAMDTRHERRAAL